MDIASPFNHRIFAAILLLLCTLISAQAQESPITGVWLGDLGTTGKLELHINNEDGLLSLNGTFQTEETEPFRTFESSTGAFEGGIGYFFVDTFDLEPEEFVLTVSQDSDSQLKVVFVDRNSALNYPSTLNKISDFTVLAQSAGETRLWKGFGGFVPFALLSSSEIYQVRLELKRLPGFFESFVLAFEETLPAQERFALGLRFDLTATTVTDFIGSWTIDDTISNTVPALNRSTQFRSGRVSAFNFFSTSTSSDVLFKTPDGLTTLGQVRFLRYTTGVPLKPTYVWDPGATESGNAHPWLVLNAKGSVDEANYIVQEPTRPLVSTVLLEKP